MNIKDDNLTYRHYTADQINNYKLQIGDILLEKSGGGEKTPVGRIVYNDVFDNALCANFISVLRTDTTINSKYLAYLLKASYLVGLSEYLLNQTIGIQNLSLNEFIRENFCMPILHEQTLIANFLDDQCSKIDSIIADIEKQIELLGEYKKSLITETVTKGLNKTVPMKDSGIEWIGEIAEGWEVKKVKYIASLKGRIGWQGLTSDEYIDEGPYLITGVDFKNGKVEWDSCVHISKERWEEAREIQIENGDLLITKDGTVGKVAIVSDLDDLASLNSGVLLIRTILGFDRKFLFWVLLSEEFWVWFRLKNAGNSTIIHLYQNDFNEFKYTMPKYKEQTLIADYLDVQCSKIDAIIEDKKEQLTKITEHKKSLIYEYVTGKKRVKGAQYHGN